MHHISQLTTGPGGWVQVANFLGAGRALVQEVRDRQATDRRLRRTQLFHDATEQAASPRTAGCPRWIGGVPQARRCAHSGSCRRDDPGGGDALWWPPRHHRPPGRWWPAVRAVAQLRHYCGDYRQCPTSRPSLDHVVRRG